MSIYIDVTFSQEPLIIYQLPFRYLDIRFTASYKTGEAPIVVSSLSYTAKFTKQDNSTHNLIVNHVQPISPTRLQPNKENSFYLRIPLCKEIVGFIEEYRDRDKPLVFTFFIGFNYSRLFEQQKPNLSNDMYPIKYYLMEEHEHYTKSDIRFIMSREQWLNVLEALEWGFFEVFEVPVKRLQCSSELNRAIIILKGAENAFRIGHYEQCILEARKAIEEAVGAKTGERNSQDKNKFELFLSSIFDDKKDPERKDISNNVMKGVAVMRNLVSHGDNNHTTATRADAEFVLCLTISLFRYFGQIEMYKNM